MQTHSLLLLILFAFIATYMVYHWVPKAHECFEVEVLAAEDCRILQPEKGTEVTCGEQYYIKGIQIPDGKPPEYLCCKPNLKAEMAALSQVTDTKLNAFKLEVGTILKAINAKNS